MAKPIRMAKNRFEAKAILLEIAEAGPLQSKSEVTARLTSRTIGKIVSFEAAATSFDQAAHFLAVANLDKLFSNAIEPWKFEFNPNKQNKDLKERRVLYAPLEYDHHIIPVKFTVKEYADPSLTNKLYSLEALDVELQ